MNSFVCFKPHFQDSSFGDHNGSSPLCDRMQVTVECQGRHRRQSTLDSAPGLLTVRLDFPVGNELVSSSLPSDIQWLHSESGVQGLDAVEVLRHAAIIGAFNLEQVLFRKYQLISYF